VKLPNISKEALELKTSDQPVKVINLVPQSILTKGSEEILPTQNNVFQANKTFNKACLIERHGHVGGIGVNAIKGYNIENGAIATSVSHDAHNITIVGDNDEDMVLAVEELDRIQGGYVIASEGKIVAALPLEVAGIISTAPGKKVQKQLNQMVAHARALGVPEAIDPFMTLSFISLTVIPELRLTDNGLYDVNLGQFV
jgi:adenine deaminase